MCGKNHSKQSPPRDFSGSPPRVREELALCNVRLVLVRITPACAGRTDTKQTLMFHFWDHPRVCGKNLPNCTTVGENAGSPPRVREELISTRLATLRRRITPACAGRTKFFLIFFSSRRDHPRVCGKNLFFSSAIRNNSGSPPRVREEPHPYIHCLDTPRITPACAGRTGQGRRKV